MPFNKAIIPLYLNSDVLNNLFSVVVQEFAEIKSVSVRDQIAVHLKGPMSEFSYDLFGKYIQGEFELHLLNEYVKQRAEANISATIVMLKQLRDILLAQSLLKNLDKAEDIGLVEESNYIDFPCKIMKNPVLQHVQNVVDRMQIESIFEENERAETITKEESERRAKMLSFFKEGLNSCRNERCIRYYTRNVCGSGAGIVIPLRTCCMLDNEDYLFSGSVRVMGKVVKAWKRSGNGLEEAAAGWTGSDEAGIRSLLSDTIFDYVDYEQLNRAYYKSQLRGNGDFNFDRSVLQIGGDLIEVLPILIYV